MGEVLRALAIPLTRTGNEPLRFERLHERRPNFLQTRPDWIVARRNAPGTPAPFLETPWQAIHKLGYVDGAPAALESHKIPQR